MLTQKALEPALKEIASQREHHTAELAKLDQAEAALTGLANGSTPAASTATSASSNDGEKAETRRGRTPGRRGRRGGPNRTDQTFDLIKANPGITIPEIAEKMKIEPNYLYRVVPKLANEKRVRKDGSGWVANAA